MIIWFLIAVILLLSGMSLRKEYDHFLPVQSTTVINGFFTILVFLSHSSTTLQMNSESILNKVYLEVPFIRTQMIVTCFLAFSGYGAMYQYLKKGNNYIAQFPKKRILTFWVHVVFAVLIYLIMSICFGDPYSIPHILLAFVGLTSLGNSNWYIFAILFMYVIFWLFAKLTNNKYKILGLMFLFSGLYLAITVKCDMPRAFYNTIFCYPFGMTVAAFEDKLIKKERKIIILELIVSTLIFLPLYILRRRLICHLMAGIMFAWIFMLLINLFDFRSKPLYQAGRYVFEIYILQRVPMGIFARLGILADYSIVSVPLVFAITVLMAILFKKAMHKIDNLLLKN